MKRKLIVLMLCLVAVFALSFAGCGKSEDTDTTDTEASAREAVTLNMWLVSEKEISAETEAAVEEALNELTQAKYTTKVDLVFLTEDAYFAALDEKLTLAAEHKESEGPALVLPGMAEETEEVVETTAETFVNELGQKLLKYPDVEEHQIDIVFLAGKELYERYASEGKLSAMDTNLNATSKVLKDYIYPSFLEQIKYEKSTYAIPNNHLIGEYTYLLVNKALAEKYYFDTDDLTSFTACADLIAEIGAYETVAPVLSYADPVNLHYWLGNNDMALIASYVPTQATLGSRTVMRSIFDTASFTEHMLLMQRCKDNGWFAADPANTEDFGVAIVKGGYDLVEKYSDKYDVKVLTYPTLEEETVYESMFAVTAYTENFDRAMEVITLINTTAEAKNILQYGVENVHYEFDDDGGFVQLNDDYCMNNLYTGNAFLAYPANGASADVWENAKAANRDSKVSPYYGLGADWATVTEGFIESLRELSDGYMERMHACTTEEELSTFFATAKQELSSNELFKAAFSTDSDSNSPYAVYSRWFQRLWPSAE